MSKPPLHHHHHHDDHGHDHHDHAHVGHNHSHADHLHSHVHGNSNKEKAEELQELATSFIEGFRSSTDKTSFLRVSNIPFHKEGTDGLKMNLVDASINSNWQIGTASPAFASRELVYMPFPGNMVQHRETMTFTYVSLTERDDVDLLDLLRDRIQPNHKGHSHEH
ncbi:MAG: hypothetical protein QNJ29_09595 [Rhizobiaceae bacterium]|nr:hypothetical protein [Rhizobiaceae bacterium]